MVDDGLELPGLAETFAAFRDVRIDGDSTLFSGRSETGRTGLYIARGATLSTVVDNFTTIPGRADTFSDCFFFLTLVTVR